MIKYWSLKITLKKEVQMKDLGLFPLPVVSQDDLDVVQKPLSLNAYIQAATSDNTRKAYRQDIQHFIRWGGLLPAT